MAGPQKVCIVGGGASGVGLLWCLAQSGQQWDITLIHDQTQLGGHSLTFPVMYNGTTYNVDIGVQFISPMLYPNVHAMLQRPEFQQLVPMTTYGQLRIGCAFPRDASGNPQNWGNFPEYQQGPNFALFSPAMQADAQLFQSFIEMALITGWASKTLDEYFSAPPQPYTDQQQFVDYFAGAGRDPVPGPGRHQCVLRGQQHDQRLRRRRAAFGHDHRQLCLQRALPAWLESAGAAHVLDLLPRCHVP